MTDSGTSARTSRCLSFKEGAYSDVVVISLCLLRGLAYVLHSAGALTGMTCVAVPGGSRYTT